MVRFADRLVSSSLVGRALTVDWSVKHARAHICGVETNSDLASQAKDFRVIPGFPGRVRTKTSRDEADSPDRECR